MIELVKVHDDLPTALKDDIKDQCVKLLNDEWPRSELLRYRTLNASKDYFPMSLALLVKPDNVVIGHVKLSQIPSQAKAIWIESVVIHPDLRGQGIGKHLMYKTEEFCKQSGYNIAYLCTIDRQVFYSRCGYQFCKPVTASSGTVGVRHERIDLTQVTADNKVQDQDLLPERTDELGKLCKQVFQGQIRNGHLEPRIQLPLRKLQNGLGRASKNCCANSKFGVHKDFMKKML